MNPEAGPRERLVCFRCGYALRGTTSESCPECGLEVGVSQRLTGGLFSESAYRGFTSAWNWLAILYPVSVVLFAFASALRLIPEVVILALSLPMLMGLFLCPFFVLISLPWRFKYGRASVSYRLRLRVWVFLVVWGLIVCLVGIYLYVSA